MTRREIQDGEYHIVRDNRPTSYPFDVMRRLGDRDYRINSFKTELHARYFAAAQNIANNPQSGPSHPDADRDRPLSPDRHRTPAGGP